MRPEFHPDDCWSLFRHDKKVDEATQNEIERALGMEDPKLARASLESLFKKVRLEFLKRGETQEENVIAVVQAMLKQLDVDIGRNTKGGDPLDAQSYLASFGSSRYS